ncbi:hypothetical protein LU298_13535 [Komagataeibacter intermedius]|uniref:Uncharacterized protein n=1 Tax=Komagataeibacter intermedius AF2 TaxID=1458464 RepID=A0A0N1FMH1_9PROT|nr:hypothetical protein [Komagataeibacter intermedius]KPH85791.1 hypothetical protein GLUCOINTEAF2_0201046 [Komagataeibacter intermedius AF2]MCF3637512.1 hypothetical protein [Komagataeibacter intermedius]
MNTTGATRGRRPRRRTMRHRAAAMHRHEPRHGRPHRRPGATWGRMRLPVTS